MKKITVFLLVIIFAAPIKKEFIVQSYPYLFKQAGYRTGFIGKFGIQIEEKDSMIQEMFDYYKSSPRSRPHFAKMEDGGKRHSAEIKGDQAIGEILGKELDMMKNTIIYFYLRSRRGDTSYEL